MTNHFHLIAVLREPAALALTLRPLLSEYSMRINALHDCVRGHLWQNRYYSCALKESHLWAALQYVELNPVRACLVERAEQYGWSSAKYHVGAEVAPPMLQMSPWDRRFGAEEWAGLLGSAGSAAEDEELRQCTQTGRPWGDAPFVGALEESLGRKLQPQPVGRPRRKQAKRGEPEGQAPSATQHQFSFGAERS